jgi:hypothetical protein
VDNEDDLLRIEIEVSPINLVESPEKIFCSTVNIIAARIIREVIAQRGSAKLRFKQVDFVQEENDTRSHEPTGVDN